ncbi:nicotinate mononucleotide-dependent phosphoribosyltransferase CobT [Synechococcus sp. PCC 7336]|uniref:nicotinate mononucleotide-dependent phosphoribosyltransferase CobT n=1 Tax=Synechococcus sp. PCC 7336 TaxID=195250 RepID=UPI00034D9506|nr:TIGR00303 family protein [Synechococcus sp. PCC 7336]
MKGLISPTCKAYTQLDAARAWCQSVRGLQPFFACAVGFTETALIPGISAAGATPAARRWTAIADAEVLLQGYSSRLPTAPEGYPSPVVISQAICQQLDLPLAVFDCGLPERVPGAIAVQPHSPSTTAACLSTGRALSRDTVETLFECGLHWGERLAAEHPYVAIGECVAGGTTTALAVLMALGFDADGMVNSSHPVCNHPQKLALVRQGLAQLPDRPDALAIAAAVGDPVQPFAAGMTLSASRTMPVLLAGGTQMLAVYALARRLASEFHIPWQPSRVAVGTTRWVAEDPTGRTVDLAELLAPLPLLATQLSFLQSQFSQLQAYERGYVKEGVGAGGLAIAASLYADWSQPHLLAAIETTYTALLAMPSPPTIPAAKPRSV